MLNNCNYTLIRYLSRASTSDYFFAAPPPPYRLQSRMQSWNVSFTPFVAALKVFQCGMVAASLRAR